MRKLILEIPIIEGVDVRNVLAEAAYTLARSAKPDETSLSDVAVRALKAVMPVYLDGQLVGAMTGSNTVFNPMPASRYGPAPRFEATMAELLEHLWQTPLKTLQHELTYVASDEIESEDTKEAGRWVYTFKAEIGVPGFEHPLLKPGEPILRLTGIRRKPGRAMEHWADADDLRRLAPDWAPLVALMGMPVEDSEYIKAFFNFC